MSRRSDARTYGGSYQNRWFWPATLLITVVSVLAGSFFGRVNTVQCDRPEDVCSIESRGLLYSIDSQEIPLSKIRGFQAIVTRHESRRQNSRQVGWTHLSASLAIQGQGQRFPLSLEVHDWFSYTKPVIAAGAKLQAFLQDPSESTIEVRFGTHRTGFCFIALLLGLGLWGAVHWGRHRLHIVATPGEVRRNFVDESSDSYEPVPLTKVEISLPSPYWSFSGNLFKNSDILWEEGVVFISPWGACDDARASFPATLPPEAREEIRRVLQLELSLVPGRPNPTKQQAKAREDWQRAHAQKNSTELGENRDSRRKFLIPVVAMGLLFVGVFGYFKYEKLQVQAAASALDEESREEAALLKDPAQNGRTELEAMLTGFKERGCKVLSAPESKTKAISGYFESPAGGNCVHLLAAVPEGQSASAQFTLEEGKLVTGKGPIIDLERCPTADLRHDYKVASDTGGPISASIVECPAPEKFHSQASGFDRVAAAMTRLQALGCRQILVQPKPRSGKQEMEASVSSNAQCVNVVAATGVHAGRIALKVGDPTSEKSLSVQSSPELHLALCSTTAGAYPMQFLPETRDYYTVGALNCPAAVTRRITQKFNKETPQSASSLEHLTQQ